MTCQINAKEWGTNSAPQHKMTPGSPTTRCVNININTLMPESAGQMACVRFDSAVRVQRATSSYPSICASASFPGFPSSTGALNPNKPTIPIHNRIPPHPAPRLGRRTPFPANTDSSLARALSHPHPYHASSLSVTAAPSSTGPTPRP